MRGIFSKNILTISIALMLLGCGEEDEAKKLGFSSVSEMTEIHAQGWHTKERYDEDHAKGKVADSSANKQQQIERLKAITKCTLAIQTSIFIINKFDVKSQAEINLLLELKQVDEKMGREVMSEFTLLKENKEEGIAIIKQVKAENEILMSRLGVSEYKAHAMKHAMACADLYQSKEAHNSKKQKIVGNENDSASKSSAVKVQENEMHRSGLKLICRFYSVKEDEREKIPVEIYLSEDTATLRGLGMTKINLKFINEIINEDVIAYAYGIDGVNGTLSGGIGAQIFYWKRDFENQKKNTYQLALKTADLVKIVTTHNYYCERN